MCRATDMPTEQNTTSISNQKKPTCFLVGEDHLLIQCGDILIDQNFHISGIYSPLNEAEQWAIQNNILYFSSYKDLEQHLLTKKFDFLFSIVNSHIISDTILKNVRKIAINYHDGPLPRYGGANATGFAILNNEKHHGVTWHIISEIIDGGDILAQSIFDIDSEETTFSLNLKCYQHGLKEFEKLIKNLVLNNYRPKKQNMNNRLYHNLEKKPVNNGWLAWDNDAEYIERSMRAFNVGNYKNKFSSLKFKLDNQAYLIHDIKNTQEKSRHLPGKITKISNDYWKISTKTTDVVVSYITDICGQQTPLDTLSLKHNIKINYQLISPNNKYGSEFKKISENIFENEVFWVKKFQKFHLSEFPFFEFPNKTVLKNKLIILSKLKITQKTLNDIKKNILSKNDLIDFFISIWFVYLFKLGNENTLSILIKKNNTDYCEFISKDIPFNININENFSFLEIFSLVKKRRSLLEGKKGFLKDIFFRYPDIKAKHQFPIMVIFDDHINIEHSNSLIFKISLEKNELTWLVDENLIDESSNLQTSSKNISHHYRNLINSICINFNTTIQNANIFSKIEKRKILQGWNTTEKLYKKSFLIHQIIEEISNKYPNKQAVIYDKKTITYQELNKRSNVLATYLIKNCYCQKHIIVYCEKSIDLIITLLGIMKSGNIYIPIPVTSPFKNIELIIQNSSHPLIITNEKLVPNLEKLSIHSKLDILLIKNIPTLKNQIENESFENIELEYCAYILHTSGTTGIPKGVLINHTGLTNLILYTISKLKITKQTRILQFASIGFDASIWEILSTLSAGATLCIPNQEELLGGVTLKNVISQYKISCIILPPSALQTISQYSLPTLKTVVTGGEYCSKELAAHWATKAYLINAYGPTEATVCVAMAVINNTSLTSPPIGSPISNTKFYILDKNLSPVPIGVVGELYISGVGLSPGYLNNEELTKKFFIKNPYVPNKKMYRTRDLVRWLPSGETEYIGRVDNQVKIRGFRIELEAIETQILHDLSVKQCAVVVQENQTHGKYLIAFLKGKKNTINIKKLRASLKRNLPEYMIPNFFLEIDTFSITHTGKVDRKKLPKFDPHIRPDFSSYKAPNNILEQQLTEIWSELLKLSPVGIEDNFFDLGGHSLIVTNLSVYIQEKFNYILSLRDFFKNPTISNLAKLIENEEKSAVPHEDLSKDIALPDEVRPCLKINNKLQTILLTGCTGFLGSHILFELLKTNKYKVYCLIRTDSKTNGLNRIKEEFNKYHLSITHLDKIYVVCGDLSKPKLDIANNEFDLITEEVDLICHNGAYVHHLYSYEMLKSSNVDSTIELLKICSYKKNKELHYISTLSAITNEHMNNNMIEEKFVDYNIELPQNISGYNQTKLVSEYLLSQARDRGLCINIYRPAWIMGQHTTGIVSPEKNHLLLLIKGCIQIGIAPTWNNFILTILPVDFVSKLITNVISEKSFKNTIFNLSDNSLQIPWIELICFFNSNGYPIKLVSTKIWQSALRKITPENAMYNLLPLYRDEKDLDQKMYDFSSIICNKNTQMALTKTHLDLNLKKEELLNKYLTFLKTHKFL